jgi:hypothetical protein
MGSMTESVKKGLVLLCGLAIFLVLQGCTTPLVDVKVSTCDRAASTDEEGAGACYSTGLTPGTQPQKCRQGNQTVPCPGGATCTSGTKCQSNPGSCNFKPCKTIMALPGSSCYCDCNY